ncbi:MAG: acyloxyacyl hydrolase [Rickettsiales bacterium]|nr:acyloxyacyl hydrolase [Rickettsiales bacterium]
MTNFNIPVTASIGHRFDNGMVAELTWKHYSNGHIGHYNHQVNNLGVSVRYTF